MPSRKMYFCPGFRTKCTSKLYWFEPATMRSILNNFDPKKQVKNRIAQLESVGHDVSKIELIIMGGTFNAEAKNIKKILLSHIRYFK